MYCSKWFPPLFYDSTHLIIAYKQFAKLRKFVYLILANN